MQKRHKDRYQYFTELADTSREFYIDYLRQYKTIGAGVRILEIGCGDGGNLLPFAEAGCDVTGIDLLEQRAIDAKKFFNEKNVDGTFIAANFLDVPVPSSAAEAYDIILIHDVIEHIEPPHKTTFIQHMQHFMRDGAVVFFAFPAWQMPFGGHQQICNSIISKLPYIHLLPTSIYRHLLTAAHEPQGVIDELLSIKRAKMPIERFEHLMNKSGLKRKKRNLWLINPHYKRKFGLHPVRLVFPFSHIPWLRNFYTTSVWYLVCQ